MRAILSMEKPDSPSIGGIGDLAIGATDWFLDAKETVQDVGEAASGAVDFAQDPLGAIAEGLQAGAAGLVNDLLPALFAATSPDLTVRWFVSAYSLSFALGIIVWGFLLLFQMLGVARGRGSGAAFLEALLTRSGMYFGGVLFGPMLAMVLVNASEALTNSLVTWGITDTAEATAAQLGMLLDRDMATIIGGTMIAVFLLLAMVLGLLFVVFMQVILLVTLYMSGVFVPIALAWITSGKHESFGLRIVYAWVGLLLSQPLLVFVLGVSFKFIASTMDTLGGGKAGAAVFIQLCAAVVALTMAGLAPLALLKFAPVIPKGGQSPDGPELSLAGLGPQSLREANETFRSHKSEPDSDNTAGEGQSQDGPESEPGGQTRHGGNEQDGPLVSHHRNLNNTGGPGSEEAGAPGASGTDAGTATSASAAPAASGAGASAGAASAAGRVGGVGLMALKKGADAAESGAHVASDAMDANASDMPDARGDDD